jgi:hypothetical protein
MRSLTGFPSRALLLFACSVVVCLTLSPTTAQAQDTVTGAFEGTVTDARTRAPIAGASVQFINQLSEVPIAKRTDSQGRFYQGLLPPGTYTIRASAPGYKSAETEQRLLATRPNQVVPVPFVLDPETGGATVTPTPVTTGTPGPTASPTPVTRTSTPRSTADNTDIVADINTTDGRRSGAFTEEEVSGLPLGATTLIRSFDELALFVPGVALAPETEGDVAGPGVGSGVGSAGQFAVNGLRSRANNFTVDGSDNNDEDIGVRRQGFLSLVPQPIESIKEFQIITLLAPAQFGRNIGAQVNAISKSGGNTPHGTLYAFYNSREMNSPTEFDTNPSNAEFQLRSGNFQNRLVNVNGGPLRVRGEGAGEDPFSLLFGGFAVGGPIKKDKAFFFVSGERQRLNASKEKSFAVPTVEERGLFATGAQGLFASPFSGLPTFAFPTSFDADAIFSLFPFPNNPTGIYGQNTYTRVLPADGRGSVFSAKTDFNFKALGRQQTFTARYNVTDDNRIIPVTGEAIFSSLNPSVLTQNISTFLNSELSGPDSTSPVFNQLRLSYGRTRLRFGEVRDTDFQVQSTLLPDTPFLLNAPFTTNLTLPNAPGVPNTGPVIYGAPAGFTAEDFLGPVGQVTIAGFSPLGVDVFNFPQRRVNNTYQLADNLSLRTGGHAIVFGTDIRRTELNSDLPRNSRPLITFNGAPTLAGFYISGIDLAAASAPSGFFQTIATTDSGINLRYYQYNFFAQDEWRIRPNLSLSFGVRYEYNTPPKEANSRIENTFNSPLLNLLPGLRTFIDGRTEIFEPDKNNFAPRIGLAYSPNIFGRDHSTVFRAGYGLYYDQILGAVVSQSRNVFPNFLTINFAGGFAFGGGTEFFLVNPNALYVQPGTLNRLDPSIDVPLLVALTQFLTDDPAFSVTLPARQLDTPMAHHYSLTIEQQLSRNLVFSAAYVGTQGRNLLRATTPNLGPNAILLPLTFSVAGNVPSFSGVALPPGILNPDNGRPVGGGVGAVNIFRTIAESRYDSLQLQLRGRFRFLGSTQFQVNYVYSKSDDDASDVFDLAGSSALPQNSLTFAGEYAPSNFDARHRFSYSYVSSFPEPGADRSAAFRFLFGGWQWAGTGIFQTGQPFTVISTFDVNLDGNLTDRPDSRVGIQETGDRARPLRLTVNPFTLLANVGEDGSVPRNAFRASDLWITNSALIKNFRLTENQAIQFRMEIFNVFNRANYGIPVRQLEVPWFGQATDTVTPGRRITFALKYSF